MYFLQSRYYAAGIGRFLTKDTQIGSASDPGSLNRYVYTEGDPVNLIDRDGHRPAVSDGPEGLDVYNSVSAEPYRPAKVASQPAPTTSKGTKQATNKPLLVTNRIASVVSVGASIAGIVGIAVGSTAIVSAATAIIPIAATVGVLTTMGMMMVGDKAHGNWGNVAISLTGFISVPLLGGASFEVGSYLYKAARVMGYGFNIPLSGATANWQ